MWADASSSGAALPSERLTEIRAALARRGRVRVTEIASRYGVSTETARRDLRRLAASGDAVLVRGGAMSAASPEADEAAPPPVSERQSVRTAEKSAIAREAAGLVDPGQVVLLDGGTTTLAVARALLPLEALTIVTNNLDVAVEVARRDGWRVHVVGGELSPRSMSLIGLEATRGLREVAADVGFIGAAGISVERGFTSADPFESELKRSMMAACRRRVVVADAAKLEASGFSTFARPREVDLFVTSRPSHPERLQELRDEGLTIAVADEGDVDG